MKGFWIEVNRIRRLMGALHPLPLPTRYINLIYSIHNIYTHTGSFIILLQPIWTWTKLSYQSYFIIHPGIFLFLSNPLPSQPFVLTYNIPTYNIPTWSFYLLVLYGFRYFLQNHPKIGKIIFFFPSHLKSYKNKFWSKSWICPVFIMILR